MVEDRGAVSRGRSARGVRFVADEVEELSFVREEDVETLDALVTAFHGVRRMALAQKLCVRVDSRGRGAALRAGLAGESRVAGGSALIVVQSPRFLAPRCVLQGSFSRVISLLEPSSTAEALTGSAEAVSTKRGAIAHKVSVLLTVDANAFGRIRGRLRRLLREGVHLVQDVVECSQKLLVSLGVLSVEELNGVRAGAACRAFGGVNRGEGDGTTRADVADMHEVNVAKCAPAAAATSAVVAGRRARTHGGTQHGPIEQVREARRGVRNPRTISHG